MREIGWLSVSNSSDDLGLPSMRHKSVSRSAATLPPESVLLMWRRTIASQLDSFARTSKSDALARRITGFAAQSHLCVYGEGDGMPIHLGQRVGCACVVISRSVSAIARLPADGVSRSRFGSEKVR